MSRGDFRKWKFQTNARDFKGVSSRVRDMYFVRSVVWRFNGFRNFIDSSLIFNHSVSFPPTLSIFTVMD